jgi:hypothetical protein
MYDYNCTHEKRIVAISTMRGPLPTLEGVGQSMLVDSGLPYLCSCATPAVTNLGAGGKAY